MESVESVESVESMESVESVELVVGRTRTPAETSGVLLTCHGDSGTAVAHETGMLNGTDALNFG